MQAPLSLATLARLLIAAKPQRLCLVRVLVKRAAEESGFGPELAERLVVAVNEACMNIIEHAYKRDESGEIVLEILNNGSELLFRLTDRAAPIDLARVEPRNLNDIRPGGLGVHFIREIMDECRMGHLAGGAGNYLEMTKKLERVPQD